MSPSSPTLQAALDGQLCSGCGLCAGLAPDAVEMVIAPPGYLRPHQHGPLTAEQESAVAHACPALGVASWDLPGAPNIDPAWGPWRQILTGHATDPSVRYVGSSGGILTALSMFALTSGMVDAVVTIRAGGDEGPLSNPVTVVTDPADLMQAAGSRYGPSSPLVNIGTLLDDTRRFLFIGKPCDVTALRSLGTRDARVAERFALSLSFFCGGVPSLAGSEQVIRAMGIQPEEVRAFRYRGNGWPGKARADTASGSSAEMDYETCWGGYLSKHVQFRCKICPDAVGGVADIACADAWFGGETGYPQFEDREGRSLIVVRTQAGAAFLHGAVEAGAVVTQASGPGEIDLMQPSQKKRKSLVRSRTMALAATGRPRPRFRGVRLREAERDAPIWERARNFLGTVSRIVKGRQ